MKPPQTAAARQEYEMANTSHRELQAAGSTGDPLQRLRLLCLSRGTCGILQMGRTFRQLDEDGNKQLSFDEFMGGLRQIGLEISEEEAKTVFEKFDVDESGGINMDEFLVAIRPPMNDTRMRSVDEAFQKMDTTGDGFITIGDLHNVYNVKAHTRYISGEDTEENVLKEFLGNFKRGGTADGQVTREEFLNYYSGISASIENDCYFDLMMRQAYNL